MWPTVLYFIFSRKKVARERGCRALLAGGSRAEVMPDSALFPIYVCPRASGNFLFHEVYIYDVLAPCSRIAGNLCIETSPVQSSSLQLVLALVPCPRSRSRPAFPRSRGKATLITTVKFLDDESPFQRAVRCASKSLRCLPR